MILFVTLSLSLFHHTCTPIYHTIFYAYFHTSPIIIVSYSRRVSISVHRVSTKPTKSTLSVYMSLSCLSCIVYSMCLFHSQSQYTLSPLT